MSLPALVLLQLAALLGLLAAAATTGMLVTRRLPMRDRAERWAISLPVGLGTLGTGLFSIGLAGGLHRWVILILAGGVALAVWRIGIPSDSEGAGGGVQRWSRGLLVLLFSTLLPTFVWSLYPPSGFDATAYHLPFARAFATSSSMARWTRCRRRSPR